MIYLDHNATTRPLPEVVAAMTEALLANWGNPSSKHSIGEAARRALIAARAEVAQLVGAQPNEIVFTSGATEANHHVLHGALQRPGVPRRVILSAIEHAGYLKAALRLRTQGIEVELLPVDADGVLRLDALHAALRTDAALVSVMAANNETGVVQPWAEIAAIAHAKGIPVHIDATQAAGRLPLDFARSGADLMSLSAHKLHGPKGVGALVMRKGLPWPALIAGQQERGRRGGTENLPGIVGFGVAARHAHLAMPTEYPRQRVLHAQLEAGLHARVPGLRIHGAHAARLPNTTCLSIAGASADLVLARLARADICAASGAACSSGGSEPSHVLLAMGVPAREALGAVRLSLGRETTVAELDATVGVLEALVQRHVAGMPYLIPPQPSLTGAQP